MAETRTLSVQRNARRRLPWPAARTAAICHGEQNAEPHAGFHPTNAIRGCRLFRAGPVAALAAASTLAVANRLLLAEMATFARWPA
jgi:hypothetical protein